ncbi:MAG TPA: LysR family transcriptional regulator [Micromonosporaceae bacterium]|nr:LysR family transcriptional regulator [Micromonosporaceae bacterium]HCU48369.1 LysR family transcriptional regulator [Micromonosporaceae bacterium]
MDPEIRHLRAICVIAEAGSLSRAAGQLGISQPALTTLLQRIERGVGGQLFIRERTGVRPTALGEHAVARARLVLSELDGFIGDLGRTARSSATAINMGTVHMECVGTMMMRLRQAMPDLDVNLLVEPSALTLSQSLAHRRLDIALVGMMDDHVVSLPTNLAQRIFITRLPVFIAIAETHRLAAQAEIALADLANEHWICPPGPDDGSLASLREACRLAGFEPSIRYQAPSGGGRALITSGQAVQLVEPASNPIGGLITRPLTGEPLRMRLILAWHRDRITPEEANHIYSAIAHAYTQHAVASPTYAPWWAAHPEVHPSGN